MTSMLTSLGLGCLLRCLCSDHVLAVPGCRTLITNCHLLDLNISHSHCAWWSYSMNVELAMR